jgi:ribosome maturation factor RimP
MGNEAIFQVIGAMIASILEGETSYFVVDTRIKPTNNIKLFIDGDQGITIEKCVQINRLLYKKLEESGLFPDGDFSLEVSSPGLDEPLKLLRQYRKNVGRQVEVQLLDGSIRLGRLVEVQEEDRVVEENKEKKGPGRQGIRKPELVHLAVSFNNIKTTKIHVVF